MTNKTLYKLADYVTNILNTELESQFVSRGLKSELTENEESFRHVVAIGVSVLQTRYKELKGLPGGSFVQALVDNDLVGTFSRADRVNKLAIGFYLRLMFGFSPVTFLKTEGN